VKFTAPVQSITGNTWTARSEETRNWTLKNQEAFCIS